MDLPKNRFKERLLAGEPQIGVWNSIPGHIAVELLAAAGFDWVLIDTEHAPTDVGDVLPALQAVAAYPATSAVVRPATNDTVLIKRLLDLGAQTLLVPYVQSVAEAEAAVCAMRYPPRGVRGVAGLHRAARFGMVEGYTKVADEEMCLLVQVETRAALDRLEDIANVDGVDGVFIGPADLAASLGHPGELSHEAVVGAIDDAIARLRAAGTPAGVLMQNADTVRRWMALGTTFTAVGADLGVLAKGVAELAAAFLPSHRGGAG